jgi:hypothetical protein
MKLIYKATGIPVTIGDKVQTTRGEVVVVEYFKPPHKPESEGKIVVSLANRSWLDARPYDEVHRCFYCSVIGAEWIEREDRESGPAKKKTKK